MAVDPDIEHKPIAPAPSAEAGKPDRQDLADAAPANAGYEEGTDPAEIDRAYWIACLEDAERAEREWRSRGREIIEIYRNESRNHRTGKIGPGAVTFNILFSNTEVTLPAIYKKPAQPVVRSRFVKVTEPMMPPPAMMMGMPGAPTPGVGGPFGPPPTAAGGPSLPPSMPPPIGGAMPPMAPPVPPELAMVGPPAGPPGGGPPIDLMASAAPMAMDAGMGMPQPDMGMGMPPMGQPPGPIDNGPPPMPTPPGGLPGMPPPAMPGLAKAAPGRPSQEAIESAAAIMEKALEIVTDDDNSHEAVKLALKDFLLPGRGVVRVRWRPQMETRPVMAGDGMTPLPGPDGAPQTEEIKVWEELSDEYVFWEDFLCDPVRQAVDTDWIAFRHLFTQEALETEFAGSEQYESLKAARRLGDILKWTDESAAKTPVGGGSAMKTASKLGDHVKKAMIWEIWDRKGRRVIWFIREVSGLVLRVDEDSYALKGFYPIPIPVLSVRTTDSRIPVPFYDLYANLANDLDETSKRISKLTKQLKARGAYNGASKEIANILTADDQKMIAVNGVDLVQGGLAAHIWMVPIDLYANVLEKLYLARDQLRSSIYEVMGISDIMRGNTNPNETATAQRIKGTMGVNRLDDAKQQAGNFVRDLMRIKAELIAQNFAPETLEAMTGEQVTPEVEAILRSDFMRTCGVDIEADSTVEVDIQVEQEAMAQVAQAIGIVMSGAQSMLQTGVLPPPMVINLSLELLKMFLHPIRYARGVTEMIADFQEQLTAQIAMQAMMPPAPMQLGGPPGGMPPGAMPLGAGGPPGGGPPPPNGAGISQDLPGNMPAAPGLQ